MHVSRHHHIGPTPSLCQRQPARLPHVDLPLWFVRQSSGIAPTGPARSRLTPGGEPDSDESLIPRSTAPANLRHVHDLVLVKAIVGAPPNGESP